uniref:hypothetical protein n=1 Tax=Chryseobacterium sp. TaxID=1871047 RepID=UPI0024E1F94A
IDQKGFPIFIALLIYLFVFTQELLYSRNLNDIPWEALIIPILIIGNIIILGIYKTYRDKYFMILCFIALLLSTFVFTGITNPYNYHQDLPLSFILPMSLFIISSIILIVKYFKKE